MQLVLNIQSKDNNIKINVSEGNLIEIDQFTTEFKDSKELFEKILNYSNSIDINDIEKYNFYIQDSEGRRFVMFKDYKFITDSLLRRNARIFISKKDKERIISYIEGNFYFLLLLDDTNKKIYKEKYKYAVIYDLYNMITDKNFKYDANYYNFFVKKIEPYYNIIRDFIFYTLDVEEKEELNKRDNRPSDKNLYKCEIAGRNLEKEYLKALNSKKEKKKKICLTREDEDYQQPKEEIEYDDWYIPDEMDNTPYGKKYK